MKRFVWGVLYLVLFSSSARAADYLAVVLKSTGEVYGKDSAAGAFRSLADGTRLSRGGVVKTGKDGAWVQCFKELCVVLGAFLAVHLWRISLSELSAGDGGHPENQGVLGVALLEFLQSRKTIFVLLLCINGQHQS